MKFFHLSDLHIGLKLINRDLREDQEYILKQITDMAEREKPDAVLIAGDIYDKAVPSAEAVEVFDRFIAGLAAALPDASIMLISGNHDSGPRLNCFRSVLSRQSVYMIGMPPTAPEDHIEKVVLRDEYGRVNFYLLPFVRPSMVRQITGSDENGNVLSYNETLRRLIEREELDLTERNVLVSHQFYLPSGRDAGEVERMDSEICTVGNIDRVDCHEHNRQESVLSAAVRHTVHIFAFILVFNVVIGAAVELTGLERLTAFLSRRGVFQPLISGLVGLIPNCAASILLTQLYMDGVISFGSVLAGLCTGAGVGLAVIFRSNKNLRQNLFVLLLLYITGCGAGMAVQLAGIVI